jgi:membrane-associated phospholipid phosphatase
MPPIDELWVVLNERVKLPLAGFLACLVALALLAGLAYQADSVGRFDGEAVSGLSAPRESVAANAASVARHLADPLPILVLLGAVCGLALRLGSRCDALAAVALAAGASLTTLVLKAVLAHPRYQPILGYRQIGSTSFPSGHATASLSIAFVLVLVAPRSWRLPAALVGAAFAIAVGLAVVILNRHFPSDVLGGWLVTAAWFFAVLAVLRTQPGGLADRAGGDEGQDQHTERDPVDDEDVQRVRRQVAEQPGD